MERCTSTDAYLMKEVTAEEGQRTPLRRDDKSVDIGVLEAAAVLAYKVRMKRGSCDLQRETRTSSGRHGG